MNLQTWAIKSVSEVNQDEKESAEKRIVSREPVNLFPI
jgi:hypothetical protein